MAEYWTYEEQRRRTAAQEAGDQMLIGGGLGDATTFDDGGSDEPIRPPAEDEGGDDSGEAPKKKKRKQDSGDIFDDNGNVNIDAIEEFFIPGKKDFDTDTIKRIYGLIGAQSMRSRRGLYEDRLMRERELAAGSPAALLQKFGAQVSQMREQLDHAFGAVSKRLGPNAGGQREKSQADLLSRAASGLQGMMATGQQQGVAGLHAALGLQPVQGANIPTKFTQTEPFDPAQLGRALAGAADAIYGFTGGNANNTNNNPVSPYPYQYQGYSGMNPHTGQLIQGQNGMLGSTV